MDTKKLDDVIYQTSEFLKTLSDAYTYFELQDQIEAIKSKLFSVEFEFNDLARAYDGERDLAVENFENGMDYETPESNAFKYQEAMQECKDQIDDLTRRLDILNARMKKVNIIENLDQPLEAYKKYLSGVNLSEFKKEDQPDPDEEEQL